METITIGGITINSVLTPVEEIEMDVQRHKDDFRNKLISGCKDFKRFVQSAHALIYYDFKGSEIVSKMVHETLSKADELVASTEVVLLQHEVDVEMLRAYSDTIVELGDTIRNMMRKLGY